MDIELRDIEDDDQTAIEVTANHQCLSSMGLNLDFTKIDENKQPKVKVIESQRTAKSAVSNVSNVSNAQRYDNVCYDLWFNFCDIKHMQILLVFQLVERGKLFSKFVVYSVNS